MKGCNRPRQEDKGLLEAERVTGKAMAMDNIKMNKTDDGQYCGHLSAGRYYLAEVRYLGEQYGIYTGIVDILDYQDDYEEFVSSYYGTAEQFEKLYPKISDREQLFAEMCFEYTPKGELSCAGTYLKHREAMDALADKFQTRRLFIDMDGTLTCFTPSTMEQLDAKGYFRNRIPQSKVVAAMRMMINEAMNVDCFILSGVLDNPYARDEKTEWLRENLPELDEEHTIFVPCGKDKSGYVPGGVGKYDFLLDDFSLNLHEWPSTAIKLKNNLNGTKGTWNGKPMVHYNETPEKIKRKLMQYLFAKESQVNLSGVISTCGQEAALKLKLGDKEIAARLHDSKDGLPYIGVFLQSETDREMEFCRITAYPDVETIECRIVESSCDEEEIYLITTTTEGFELQYQE